MHSSHLAASVGTSIFESELDNAPRGHNRDILDTYRRIWVKTVPRGTSNDLKNLLMFRGGTLELDTCVEILSILANNYQINILITRAQTGIGFGRTQISIEVKPLPQGHISTTLTSTN